MTNYPTLLADGPAPTLRAHPQATVVADTLHAVTVLGMTNTRMKDFFDLRVLLNDTMLDDAELQRAIEATFTRRKTARPGTLPIGLSDAFAEDATKQVQWRAFLKKNRLQAMHLVVVVSHVREPSRCVGFADTQSSRQTPHQRSQSTVGCSACMA